MGFLNVAVKSNPKIFGLNFFRYSGKGMTLYGARCLNFPHVASKISHEIDGLKFFRYTGKGINLYGARCARYGSVALGMSISPLQDTDTVENSYPYF